MAGKWVRCESGTLVSLDKIETLAIKMGAKGYEVRAYLPGDPEQTGFYVLFSHADRAVCEEWLDRFAEEYLDVLQPVVLLRDCPQCYGTGALPIGPNGSDETCSFCGGKRKVTLEAYESAMWEWGLKP